MAIDSISSINSLYSILNAQNTQAAALDESATSFSDVIQALMQPVEQSDAVAKADTLELIAGEMADTHNIMIDAEKADLTLRMTLAVRNKVLDAYNEIMRMQV